jgi:hypothetical protein
MRLGQNILRRSTVEAAPGVAPDSGGRAPLRLKCISIHARAGTDDSERATQSSMRGTE